MTDLHSMEDETSGGGIDDNSVGEIEAACAAAQSAFDRYRTTETEGRARFLEAIGTEIERVGDALIETAMQESGLPRARLEGERGRTIGQLKMFANVVRCGEWAGLRRDTALPERVPPRPDLRLRMVPLGPVAVFGASNFPLAFSTAGGDTASALAAGCPVIVKGHPAHPRTSATVAEAVLAAARDTGMPEGVFAHLSGSGNELGAALVQDPRIAAVGFTGSRSGGLALLKLAQARPVPIPLYAEMSSVNPVILFPLALANRGAELGAAFVQSLTMGAGQFCTNPGLVLAIDGEGLDAFLAAAGAAVAAHEPAPMLTPGIRDAYLDGTARLKRHSSIEVVAQGGPGSDGRCGQAALFAAEAEAFRTTPLLREEIFGASSLVVRCRDEAELAALLAEIEGQLTITFQLEEADMPLAARLMPVAERKAGRILVNGWPTGVEVTHAMVHGGPFPATSDARTTSVGSLAIDRFLRPVCYQNMPEALLPRDLRDSYADWPVLVDGTHTVSAR